MKTQLQLAVILVSSSLAVMPLRAQAQSATYVETSKIVGTTVKTAQGEQIGEIKDVVLDSNTGCIAYTVVATGGTSRRVTGTSKTVVVPWTVYSSVSPETHVYTVRVEKEKVYDAPVFEYSHVREYSNPQWISQVYSHYGVSESTGVSGGVNYRGSTTTGTESTTTNAGASAGASATAPPSGRMTPGATGSPSASPVETSSPTESASPSASPRGRNSASHEASPATKGKTHGATTPSSRRHSSETEMTPSQSREERSKPEDSDESQSKQTRESSRGHRTEESTPPETRGTPEPH